MLPGGHLLSVLIFFPALGALALLLLRADDHKYLRYTAFIVSVLAVATVLSLWDVADDLTERFMSSFFGRLKQGMRLSTALSDTQREFARNPDPRIHNPSTWAAFVLYGGS